MSTISITPKGLLPHNSKFPYRPHQELSSDVLLVAPLPRKVLRPTTAKLREYINSSVLVSPPQDHHSPSQLVKARGINFQDAEIRLDDASSYGYAIVKAVRIKRRRSTLSGKMYSYSGSSQGANNPSVHVDDIADNGEACAELLEIMNGRFDTKERPLRTTHRPDASGIIRHHSSFEMYYRPTTLSKNSSPTENETIGEQDEPDVFTTGEADVSTNDDPNEDESVENLVDEEVSSPTFQKEFIDVTGRRISAEEDVSTGSVDASDFGLGQSPISRTGNPMPFNSPFGHWNYGSAKYKHRPSQILLNQNLRSISFNNYVHRSQSKTQFNIPSTRRLSSPSLSKTPVQPQESTLPFDHDKCEHAFDDNLGPSLSSISGSVPYRFVKKPVILDEYDSSSGEEETDLHEEEIQTVFARLRARSLSVGDRPIANPPGY